MAKKIDYDGMIAVYDYISRERELTPEESARLLALHEGKENAIRCARYREKHRDRLLEKRREKYHAVPGLGAKRSREYRARNPYMQKMASRRWRAKNPEKAAEHVRIASERRRQKNRQAAESGASATHE